MRAAILKQAGGSIEALNKQYQPAFTTLADVLNFRESPLANKRNAAHYQKRCPLNWKSANGMSHLAARGDWPQPLARSFLYSKLREWQIRDGGGLRIQSSGNSC